MKNVHEVSEAVSIKKSLVAWLSVVIVAGVLATTMSVKGINAAAVSDKVDICHATASHANPYVSNSPNKSGDVSGHDGHDGPIWYSGIQEAWGDIIPPFDYDGGSYPGKNWTAEGQEIWNNDCEIASPSTSPTSIPSATPTTTPTTIPTPPPVSTPTTTPEPDGDSICELAPQQGRVIVEFNDGPIYGSTSRNKYMTALVNVNIPTGVYAITMQSYDEHIAKPGQNQLNEQYYLELSNGQTTDSISDLPDDQDTLIELVHSSFGITDNITTVKAVHPEYPGEVNSIVPICAAFDIQEREEEPTPTPTPQDGGDGPNIGDSNDPDNPAGTPEPRVAGVTAKATPTPTPVPQVAGVEDTFTAPATGMSAIPSLVLALTSAAATAVYNKRKS